MSIRQNTQNKYRKEREVYAKYARATRESKTAWRTQGSKNTLSNISTKSTDVDFTSLASTKLSKLPLIITIEGGLGNQIWHLCTALFLQHKTKRKIILCAPDYGYTKNRNLEIYNFKIPPFRFINKYTEFNKRLSILNKILNKFLSKISNKIISLKWIHIPTHKFKSLEQLAIFLTRRSKIFLQREYHLWDFRNFLCFKQELSKMLTPSENLKTKITNNKKKFTLLKNIESSQNACMVHIRRGDYEDLQHIKLLDIDYYKKAMNIINKQYKDARFFIFGNGLDFMKEHFSKIENCEIVESEEWEVSMDFVLMRACKHHIVANSTLSFWAGFLSDGQVIYPKNCLSDLELDNLHPECIKNAISLSYKGD